MSSYWLGVAGALATVTFVFELLRRGILRERFAALWLAVCGVLLLLVVVPGLLRGAASLFGVEVPSNLLFFLAILFLLLVSVQLSFEVSRLEVRTRRLAEEHALLAGEVRALRELSQPSGRWPPEHPAPWSAGASVPAGSAPGSP
ncbi:MAG: DUF2304 domain-containing protein [Candidatus Nanopelagicales bacterium]